MWQRGSAREWNVEWLVKWYIPFSLVYSSKFKIKLNRRNMLIFHKQITRWIECSVYKIIWVMRLNRFSMCKTVRFLPEQKCCLLDVYNYECMLRQRAKGKCMESEKLYDSYIIDRLFFEQRSFVLCIMLPCVNRC